jgi:hypothetical protein
MKPDMVVAANALKKAAGVEFNYDNATFDEKRELWRFSARISNAETAEKFIHLDGARQGENTLIVAEPKDFEPFKTLADHLGIGFFETLDSHVWNSENYGYDWELDTGKGKGLFLWTDDGWLEMETVEKAFLARFGQERKNKRLENEPWKTVKIYRDCCHATTWEETGEWPMETDCDLYFGDLVDKFILVDCSIYGKYEVKNEEKPEMKPVKAAAATKTPKNSCNPVRPEPLKKEDNPEKAAREKLRVLAAELAKESAPQAAPPQAAPSPTGNKRHSLRKEFFFLIAALAFAGIVAFGVVGFTHNSGSSRQSAAPQAPAKSVPAALDVTPNNFDKIMTPLFRKVAQKYTKTDAPIGPALYFYQLCQENGITCELRVNTKWNDYPFNRVRLSNGRWVYVLPNWINLGVKSCYIKYVIYNSMPYDPASNKDGSYLLKEWKP